MDPLKKPVRKLAPPVPLDKHTDKAQHASPINGARHVPVAAKKRSVREALLEETERLDNKLPVQVALTMANDDVETPARNRRKDPPREHPDPEVGIVGIDDRVPWLAMAAVIPASELAPPVIGEPPLIEETNEIEGVSCGRRCRAKGLCKRRCALERSDEA